MKKSNTWLLAALLLFLAALTAYNLGLRAEYRSGAYKNPLRNTTALPFKDFTEVDLQAAGLMHVKIAAGPFGVHLKDAAADYVRVSQQGPRLLVAVVYPGEAERFGRGDIVTITCPRLRDLRMSAVYTVAGKTVTASKSAPFGERTVRVQGFVADSLTVRQDHATRLELNDNRLGYLRAEAGASPGSPARLRLCKGNRIEAADLSIQHQSELQMEAGNIPRLHYQFGDSAKATFYGAALVR